jgi:hypothetical protein
MWLFPSIPFHAKVKLLRQPLERAPDRPAKSGPAVSDEKTPHAEPYILCRNCLHAITRPGDRIHVDGRHRQTFANPHGMVFEIGCFRSAEGCAAIGPASEEFTWFAGHHWRVCICAACLVHLGWRFASSAGNTFYGLILDQLIEPS